MTARHYVPVLDVRCSNTPRIDQRSDLQIVVGSSVGRKEARRSNIQNAPIWFVVSLRSPEYSLQRQTMRRMAPTI